MPPLVSIIIPCFNAGPMIERCLKSCLAQSYPSIEIIVVDNNSTDQSIAVAQRYRQEAAVPITILECTEPGPGNARNAGYREAKGDYIQWLDADDELGLDKIRLQVEVLEREKDVGIAYGSWNYCVYKNASEIKIWRMTAQPYADFLLELLVDNWRPLHSYLIRRSVADELNISGGWNTHERVADDRQYFTLAALWDVRFRAVPSAWANYNRWSPKQITSAATKVEASRALAAMFQTLVKRVAERPLPHINADHRFLLTLNRGLWTWGALGLPNEKNTAEAAVVQALRDPKSYSSPQLPPVYPIEFFSILVTRSLWRNAAGDAKQMASILDIQFNNREPASPIQDRSIDTYPLIFPVLCAYRLPVIRILTKLCDKGCLSPA